MTVAALKEKNSFHPYAPMREEEAEHTFADRINHQIKIMDLLVLIAVSVFKIGCQVEGQLRELLASHRMRELAPIHILTNLHRSVKHGQLHQGHPF
jgi:hypothetical protein